MELALLIKFTSTLDKLACVSLLYTRAPIENRAENEKKNKIKKKLCLIRIIKHISY